MYAKCLIWLLLIVADQDSLCAGSHRIRFSTRLPDDIPSSYGGIFGGIKYYAFFTIADCDPGSTSGIYSRPFTVISELNFYKFPNLQVSGQNLFLVHITLYGELMHNCDTCFLSTLEST